MSEEGITRFTYDPANPPKGETDWDRLRAMTDEEVEEAARSDADNPPWTEEDWRYAWRPNQVGHESITIEVDKDVLEWFRSVAGAGGLERWMNTALRQFMIEHLKLRDAAAKAAAGAGRGGGGRGRR